ncbi:hypothetical protein H6G76_30470 [Nostoc sp. FACHB-152]|uniref:hypothetical protein n=1 Tax=unclassified Nostoc TaxID=2593658 RepID=UPI001686B622|nr:MULTISPECIES: hypothetical protein [unclassified Nostoc]MBD2451374.1 hypothetical protein [Nostoc sp. FACHB-152]MBD2471503.1 hypothetical protein [Nostoc sp. FACHB-145]
MTHVTYTHQQLRCKSLPQLKRIYSEIGCTLEVNDRRCKDSWRSAIARYQASKLQKVDEQDIAQSEFEQYIADQAQAIAPEELAIKEINPHHFEIFAGKQLIAYISYDSSEFVTQPWVVMISGNEIFRHTTQARCQRFIHWHYKDGTLPLPLPAPNDYPEAPTITEISFYDQEVSVDGQLVASVSFDQNNYQNLYWCVLVNDVEIFRDITPARCHSYVKQQYQQGTLLVQVQFEEPCTTGNEIMVQIATECDKYGLELLDDGIYTSDGEKLGEVGCTDGLWWFARVNQKRTFCDSVEDAVWLLQIPDGLPSTNEYLQYHPLEQLSPGELQGLFEIAELVAV